MGICHCGQPTVWNDMCEDCNSEWEDMMYNRPPKHLHLLIQEYETGDYMYWGKFDDNKVGRETIASIVSNRVNYILIEGHERKL